MTETKKMIRGITVNMGGDDYIMPALNLEQLEAHAAEIDALIEAEKGRDFKKTREILPQLALAALRRNYPEMTLEQLKQLIDLGNFAEVSMAVAGASGLLRRVQPGEAGPGE